MLRFLCIATVFEQCALIESSLVLLLGFQVQLQEVVLTARPVVVVAAVAVAPSGLYICFVCWLNTAKLVTLCLGGIVVVLA